MIGINGSSQKPLLLVLVGPTAVGKSALAMTMAPLLNAEIVVADSAQIYRYLEIGTAKPSPAEQSMVKHHLIDLVDPDEEFSVASYQAAAYRAIDEISGRGKLPFMVGGTGLYINAVINRYAFLGGGKNERLRKRLDEQAGRRGLEFLYRRLEQADPQAAARIHPSDQRRIVRALEVYYQEGRCISEQVTDTGAGELPFSPLLFGLTAPRDQLYNRINCRVEEMIERGFLNEAERILAAGYPPGCRGLQTLGYRQLVRYIQGGAGWEETVAAIKQATRHLAKRQLTWFRKDPRIEWLQQGEGTDLEMIINIIRSAVEGKAGAIGEY